MPPAVQGIRRAAPWIAAAMPFLALAVTVYLWGVDLPYWDQWLVAPLIEALLEGRLDLADVWRQHNDHRVFFPRLLMLAMAWATSWNIRWELAMNVACAAVVFLVVTRWLRTSSPPSPARRLAAPAVSLLVFNLNQWENWSWGLQLVVLLNVAAVAAGLWVLARGAHEIPNLVFGAALGTVATYSFSNGFLFWPLALPLVARPAGKRRARVTAWIFVAIVVGAFFFYGYSFSLGASRISLTIAEMPRAAAYAVVFLGAPVCAYDGKLAAAAGLVAVGAFAGLVVRLVRDRRFFVDRALPWMALAGYGIGSAALAAAGRLHLGLELAMSSRYIVFGNFFWLGLLGLVLVRPAGGDGAPRWPLRLSAAAVAISLVAGSVWGGVQLHQQYLERTRAREALREDRFRPDLPLVVPGNAIPREELEALERHRLSLFRPDA